MNINATIFIQAINFCIVYGLLRNLLFKPVITIIDSEAADRVALNNLIAQQKKTLEIQEKEHERYWYLCREYFKANRPEIIQQVQSCRMMRVGLKEDSSVDMDYENDALVAEVFKALEERIKDVH